MMEEGVLLKTSILRHVISAWITKKLTEKMNLEDFNFELEQLEIRSSEDKIKYGVMISGDISTAGLMKLILA